MDHSSFTRPSDNLLSKTLYIPPLRSLYLLTTLSAHCILFLSADVQKCPLTFICQLSSEKPFGSNKCAGDAAITPVSEERYMWHKRDFQLFCFPTVNKQ